MPNTYTVEKDYHNSRFDRWFKAKIIDLPQSLIEKKLNRHTVFKLVILWKYLIFQNLKSPTDPEY